ncbi:hypothetical protein [Gilliamella sp. BG6]|uniref:hypothetical protein n=1 Tax=unclassified Gilliamella TaxID=2685620 RepID=UPI003987CF29
MQGFIFIFWGVILGTFIISLGCFIKMFFVDKFTIDKLVGDDNLIREFFIDGIDEDIKVQFLNHKVSRFEYVLLMRSVVKIYEKALKKKREK